MTSTLSMLIAILAFLGTVGLIALAAAAALWLGFRGRRDRARAVALLGGGLAGVYALVLVGVGLASKERVLPAGSEKYFCELDCHLAYVVTGVRGPHSLGDGATGRPGDGSSDWVVTIRTRFDETTISSRRPRDATLLPLPRRVELVGSDGRRYEVADGEERAERADPSLALGASRADKTDWTDGDMKSTRLDQPLKPGESYLTTLRFALPAGVTPVRLFLADDVVVHRFLIGHERSPGHAPVYLALPTVPVAGR